MTQKLGSGYYTYTVTFIYMQKSYECSFQSSAKLTADTVPYIVRGLADDAIKEYMKQIPDKRQGAYPHSIVVKGEFGTLAIGD